MTDSVESTLSLLVSISDSLNKASDLLSTRISEVESALQRYKLGVQVWVEVDHWEADEGDGSSVTRAIYLGYGKIDGKWGLLIAEGFADEPPGAGYLSFLRDASRDTKLAAVDKLPNLLKKLVQEASKLANEAILKAETARQIVVALAQKQLE